jgi:peptidoglycan/LPS O-acetylase OafA/YrhL
MQQLIRNASNQQAGKLLFLDGLRGLAAAYVVLGHGRALFWEGFTDGFLKNTYSYTPFEKLQMYFFSLFKFGHEAVLFFFVLSGFVIHLKYASNFGKTGIYQFQYGS